MSVIIGTTFNMDSTHSDFLIIYHFYLADCTSNRELIECYKCIFNCLKSGHIQPMVRSFVCILPIILSVIWLCYKYMKVPSLETNT